MKNKIKPFFTILFLNFCEIEIAKASDKILSADDIIASSNKHYPQILSYYEKVNMAEGTALAKIGFFDIKLKQSYQDKSRGYYDGKVADIMLEKELGFMNSKIYGGYRKSFKTFPEYEGNVPTNSGGEYRIGGNISLLRNSGIDLNRLDVFLANLGVLESKIQFERIKKEIERDATKSYWKWVVSAKIFDIYDELYQLSLKRQNQLEERLKKGDVANIIVIENKKNILRRKSALARAKQEFDNSAIYLSLFWRSDNGKPLIANKNQTPEIHYNLLQIDDKKVIEDIEIAFAHRPEIRILKLQKEQNLKELEYAKNLYKPQLDVDFNSSKDLGDGSNIRAQTNNYVGLNFSLPLQQREAKGKSSEYESKLKSLKFEQQLVEEKIKAELEQNKTQINSIIEIYHNLIEEVKLAELLENAEREKFKNGASNFFLVNIREQDSAASKAASLEMFEKYQDALADYKMAVFSY